MFSLSQYYQILIKDTSILKMFVNSAFYTVAILLGQALVVPMMAYALEPVQLQGARGDLLHDSDVDAAAVPGYDGAATC